MSASSIILVTIAFVALYAYARVRLSAFVQPARMELIDRAERLLQHKDLPAGDRRWIEYSLDLVFSAKAAWTLALLILPLAILMRARSLLSGSKEPKAVSGPHRREILEYTRVTVMVVLSNSPMALIVFFFAIFVSELLLLPAKAAVALAVQKSSVHGHGNGFDHDMGNGKTA
ncbi:hypothetical protein [Rhizobium sp. CAU 1783]